jgi:uncharacterized integral membrane protein (TIGR00697 family)
MIKEEVLYRNNNSIIGSEPKLLGIFNSFLIISLLLCDVFIFKTITIFGFPCALSGIIFPFTSLMMICINEIYGHQQTASSLINLIVAQVFFLLGLIFLPQIPSPRGFAPELVQAYTTIFQNEWRVALSSPVGIGVTLYLSSVINSKLKTIFLGKYLVLRAMINSIVTTAILVSIIYPINFYHLLSGDKIFKICIHTYVYKIIMASFVLFLSYPIIFFAKKIEKRFIFDLDTSFNPFLIYSAKSTGVNLYDEICH